MVIQGIIVSSTNKTNRHDIIEILLKVVLNPNPNKKKNIKSKTTLLTTRMFIREIRAVKISITPVLLFNTRRNTIVICIATTNLSIKTVCTDIIVFLIINSVLLYMVMCIAYHIYVAQFCTTVVPLL